MFSLPWPWPTTLAGQQRAPHAESIRQEELRADLFFLAGDAMRGRLTDTTENLATADYIRARFERIGLKPAAPGGSYFQTYNLMTATLGDGNALQVHGADGAVRRLAHGQEFYPQRFSASGEVTAPVVFAGFGITAPRWQYDDYAGDVAGKIVLVLDHEPGERDDKSPFEGVVTAEPAAPWRKALAAQEKGAVGILFVADVHNHPGAAQLRAGRPHRVARRAAAPEDLHAVGVGRSAAHPRGADLAGRWPRRWSPAPARVARGAGGLGRNRARPRRPGPARRAGHAADGGDPPHRARPQRGRRCSRAAIRCSRTNGCW